MSSKMNDSKYIDEDDEEEEDDDEEEENVLRPSKKILKQTKAT